MRLLHLLSLTALLAVPAAAIADPIVDVSTGAASFTYGYSYNSAALAVTANATSPTAAVVQVQNSAWMPAPVGTSFIGTTAAGTDYVAAGYYDYSTTFTLSTLSGVDLSGGFAADDTIAEILLNGTVIYGGGGSFSTLTSFGTSNASLFNLGTNTLDFVLVNVFPYNSPSGLLVDADITTTPEPSSLALLGTGLFAIAAISRRKFAQS